MYDANEYSAVSAQHAAGLQKLFSAVILASLDDAIKDESKTGDGIGSLRRWFRSKDGQEVMLRAGIEPSDRALAGLISFVEAGQPTSKALSRERKKRDSTIFAKPS